MLTKILQYDVKTKSMREVEVEMEFPNPRISEIERRLQDIKIELQQSDYLTLKYIEGDLTEEEFILHKESKNALRAEYNTLEQELGGLV